MGARRKLNRMHVQGTLGLALLLGLVTGSLIIFVVTAAIGIGRGLHRREIRLRGRRRRW